MAVAFEVGPVPGGRQAELGRRAHEMSPGHGLVAGVDDQSLAGPFEELDGMIEEVLVEGVRQGHDRGQGLATTPPGAPRALPGGHDAARVTDQNGGVEPADVDAHFECRGRDHTVELTREQPSLDVPAFFRQEARAIGSDATSEPRVLPAQPGVQQLGDAPGLGEDDRLLASLEQPHEQSQGGRVGARLRTEERDVTPGPGRSAFRDDRKRRTDQFLGELAGVFRRGRGRDDRGSRALGSGEAQQAAQHVVEVAAEDAAVDVELVDDDPLQVPKERPPAPGLAEDPQVQHVRVGDQHPRRPALDARPLALRRVAVENDGRGLGLREPGGPGQLVEFVLLVLPEGLQRKQKQRLARSLAVPLACRLDERRQVEDQRLAGSRGRRHEHVLPALHRRQPRRLMGKQPRHPRSRQRRPNPLRQRLRQLPEARLYARKKRPVPQLRPQTLVPRHGVEPSRQDGIGRVGHRAASLPPDYRLAVGGAGELPAKPRAGGRGGCQPIRGRLTTLAR